MKATTQLLPIAVLLIVRSLVADGPSKQVEWPYYGGDQGGSKYSALTDINAANVHGCRVAWQWKHWETPLEQYGTRRDSSRATPLMIDGVLYVTTPYNSIAALDAETGQELWRFDGEAYKLGQIAVGERLEAARHGVLARRRQAAHLPEQPAIGCSALDAQTGKPVRVVWEQRCRAR